MVSELGHFIGGKKVAGKSGRTGEIYNPATGDVTALVPFAAAAEVNAAVQSAKQAFPAWSRTPPLTRARVMFKYKELLDRNRDKLAGMIGSEHGKVLSDATGEVTRGIEVVEFACGIPHLLKGEFTENVGTRHRQLLDAPAARRVRRHHALQLPGDGADVDVPGRDRLRQHLHLEAVASAIRRRRSSSRSCSTQAGLPEGVFNVVNGDKEAVDAILEPPGHRRRSASSARRRSPNTSIDTRHGARQARPGARRRQEPHAGDARRRHGPGGRRLDGRRLRLGRRALHGDLGRRRRRQGRRCADRQLVPRVREAQGRPGTDPEAEMGPLVTKQHLRQGDGLHRSRHQGRREARRRRPRLQAARLRERLLLGGCLFDEVTPRDAHLPRGDFRPGALGRPREDLRRGA